MHLCTHITNYKGLKKIPSKLLIQFCQMSKKLFFFLKKQKMSFKVSVTNSPFNTWEGIILDSFNQLHPFYNSASFANSFQIFIASLFLSRMTLIRSKICIFFFSDTVASFVDARNANNFSLFRVPIFHKLFFSDSSKKLYISHI